MQRGLKAASILSKHNLCLLEVLTVDLFTAAALYLFWHQGPELL